MTGEARIARIGNLPVEYGVGMGEAARILRIGDMPVVYGGSGMDGKARIEYIGAR